MTVGDYTIGELLGTGAYAKVKAGYCLKDGKKYALKIASKSYLRKVKENYRDETGELKMRSALTKIYKEIDIYYKLEHPNLLMLKEVFEDDFEDRLYMVLELAEMGTWIDWDEEEQEFYNRIAKKEHISIESLKKLTIELVDCLTYRKDL